MNSWINTFPETDRNISRLCRDEPIFVERHRPSDSTAKRHSSKSKSSLWYSTCFNRDISLELRKLCVQWCVQELEPASLESWRPDKTPQLTNSQSCMLVDSVLYHVNVVAVKWLTLNQTLNQALDHKWFFCEASTGWCNISVILCSGLLFNSSDITLAGKFYWVIV